MPTQIPKTSSFVPNFHADVFCPLELFLDMGQYLISAIRVTFSISIKKLGYKFNFKGKIDVQSIQAINIVFTASLLYVVSEPLWLWDYYRVLLSFYSCTKCYDNVRTVENNMKIVKQVLLRLLEKLSKGCWLFALLRSRKDFKPIKFSFKRWFNNLNAIQSSCIATDLW